MRFDRPHFIYCTLYSRIFTHIQIVKFKLVICNFVYIGLVKLPTYSLCSWMCRLCLGKFLKGLVEAGLLTIHLQLTIRRVAILLKEKLPIV